jgi:hypothetical protein
MGSRFRLFLLWPAAVVLWNGCFNPFAPKLSSSLESGDLLVTEQKSPEEVLQNFKVAYTLKDSLLYSGLLDTQFVFVYFDPNEGTSGTYVSWGRDVDLFTTGRLLRHFSIIDLVWNSTLYSRQEETTGEIGKTFVLTLVGTEVDYTLSGKAVFSFRKCRDDRWRITRWKDESDI